MRLKYFLLLISIGALSSCSYFIGLIQEDNSTFEVLQKKQEVLYCQNPVGSTQYISRNNQSIDLFRQSMKNDKDFEFLEKFIAFALFHQNTAPHQVTPWSKFQLALRLGGKFYLFDFSRLSEELPLYAGLEFLATKFKTKRSVLQISKILDGRLPSSIPVGSDTIKFIKTQKDSIRSHKKLGRYYVKGEQLLQLGESLPKINFTKLYERHKVKKKFRTTRPLIHTFEFRAKSDSIIRCNMDLNLYSHGIYLISQETNTLHSTRMGLYDDRGNMAIALFSQKIDNVKDSYAFLFKGQKHTAPWPVCLTKNPDILAISAVSRDPGQHLYQLASNGFFSETSLEGVAEQIYSARHLFLVNPPRLLLESSRISQDQLTRLLRIDFPLYHSPKLGEVWAYANFNNQKGIVVDDRHEIGEICNGSL